jgi:TonB family protein
VSLIARPQITKRRLRSACHEPSRERTRAQHELLGDNEWTYNRRVDMATLKTLADSNPTCERATGLADAARQMRSTSVRRRAAVGALCVFAFGALSGAYALAQQAAQPQPKEAPPAATTPSPPASKSSATASWQQSLVARLAKVQRYPAQARGVQGVVNLAFTIDRQGKVVSSKIVKSSGSTALDDEALDMIKRAAPLPPPPADIVDSDLSFVVPIRFAAR